MDRLENLRQHVDVILLDQPDLEERRCGFVHLYGVALMAALLALRRGLDADLAATAGMLHDIATYQTADPADHARRSAVEAQRILEQSGGYSHGDIATICDVIAHHSDKGAVHSPLAEALKDADALQHILYNPALPLHPHEAERLARLSAELTLGLPTAE